jgi:hypothetical protein
MNQSVHDTNTLKQFSMKSISILLLQILVCVSIRAQQYNFAPLGAKWVFSESEFLPSPNFYGSIPRVVEVTAKEMFEGQYCSRIEGVNNNFEPSFTVPEPLHVYSRNDTVFYYSLLTQKFEMLYDFTAETGDQWTIRGLNNPVQDDSMIVTVDSVKYIDYNGQTLKLQYVSHWYEVYDWNGGGPILAGVGGLELLTPEYGLYEGGFSGLRCYTDSLIDVKFVDFPCDAIISSTVEASHSTLGVYLSPNPFEEFLQIQLTSNPISGGLHFFLFSPDGQLIHYLPLTADQMNLQLPGCSAGLYFWEVRSADGRRQRGRILCSGSR